jgi:predicted ester cyclase
MSAEQVVRDFMSAFETKGVQDAIPYIADNVKVVSDNPPIEGGKNEFIGQGSLIKEAMPDYKWGIQNISTQGNEVTVSMRWSGTHTGTFRLSSFVPGAPDIPPSGKKISVPDKFIFTVSGNQISGLHIASGPTEGLGAMLQQLGIQM